MKGRLRAAEKSSSENNIIALGLFVSYRYICIWTQGVGCMRKHGSNGVKTR